MIETAADSNKDALLIEAYKKDRDLSVLARLYQPYMSMVYGVCLKYLKNREESRDAVMQLFEKLVDAVHEHQIKHFKSWLYVTARNYCLMQIRALKKRHFEDISAPGMENTIMLHLDGDTDVEVNIVKLERCIEKLAGEQRACVQLFYIQQKCYREISELTGYDDNQVKSYIQNGKRNLKICMERNG